MKFRYFERRGSWSVFMKEFEWACFSGGGGEISCFSGGEISCFSGGEIFIFWGENYIAANDTTL